MKENQELPLKIRNVTNEDVPFIFNSWLKSFRETGFMANGISNTVYYDGHHKIIQKILQRSEIWVACDERYPDQIFGYAVAERIDGIFVLHYVYVKHNFRKTGIAKVLLSMFKHDRDQASCCTHLTRLTDRFLMKYNMFYNPYIVLNNYEVYDTAAPEAVDAPKPESDDDDENS